MHTIALMSEPVLKRTPGIRRALRALAASKRQNANRAASGKPVTIGGEKMTAGAYRQKYGLPDRLKKDYEMDDETIDATDEMVEDLVKQALWTARLRVEKGDFPGHPFRGNQYARGKRSGGHGGSMADKKPHAGPDIRKNPPSMADKKPHAGPDIREKLRAKIEQKRREREGKKNDILFLEAYAREMERNPIDGHKYRGVTGRQLYRRGARYIGSST